MPEINGGSEPAPPVFAPTASPAAVSGLAGLTLPFGGAGSFRTFGVDPRKVRRARFRTTRPITFGSRVGRVGITRALGRSRADAELQRLIRGGFVAGAAFRAAQLGLPVAGAAFRASVFARGR